MISQKKTPGQVRAPDRSTAVKQSSAHHDTTEPPAVSSPIWQAAEGYATKHGWYILPCGQDKRPLTPHGVKDASKDLATIRAWARRWPKANIAVACGPSNLIALDVDKHSANGLASLDELKGRYNFDTNTVAQKTPSGGLHLIYSANGAHIGNSAGKLGPGLDIRAGNGYILLAPSTLANDAYRWIDTAGPDDITPLSFPSALIGLLIDRPTMDPLPAPGRITPYARTALEGELDKLVGTTEGGRNDQLNRSAFVLGQLVGARELDRGTVESQLEHVALQIGLVEREIRATIKSGLDKGIAQPRTIIPRRAGQALPAPNAKSDDAAELPKVELPELPTEARLTARAEREASGVGAWLNEYVKVASAAAPMCPPEFHQANGLCLISAAIARRIGLGISFKHIFPNLYVLEVAPSTIYTKTTGFDFIDEILQPAGMGVFKLPETITSPEAMMLAMSATPPSTFANWEDEDKREWTDGLKWCARRLWHVDEASFIFDSFQREISSGLMSLLLRLYECPRKPDIEGIGRGRQSIRFAYLTFVGATTPAEIARHIANDRNWGNGLWARFALVTPKDLPPFVFWPDKIEAPASLVDPIKKLAFEKLPIPDQADPDSQQKYLEVELGAGVWDAWKAYTKATMRDLLVGGEVTAQAAASYGRIGTHAMKIAMLLATVDWIDSKDKSPRVKLGHWARGQMIAEEWRASLHRMLEAPATESIANQEERKVLKVIGKAKPSKGVTRREISLLTHLDRVRVDLIVDRLLLDGLIQKFIRPGGQRAEAYRLI